MDNVIKQEDFILINATFPRTWNSNKYGALLVSESPFYNCQHCTIGRIETLFSLEDREKILEQFREITKVIGKNRNFVIEFCQKYLETIENCFDKNDFLLKQAYISTNRSKRVMCIIKNKR
jgi:hypothetical protein